MSELPPSSPPPSAPLPYEPVDQSSSNLNTLAIFYYIIAVLQALIGCLFLLYIAFGLFIAVVGMIGGKSGDAAGAAGLGGIFICLGLFFMALIGIMAYLNYLCADGLKKRKRLTL